MSESYTITQKEIQGVMCLMVSGYFDVPAGTELGARVDELLCLQKGTMVLDFSQCTVLCSRGIGCLLEIVEKVVEEFGGALAFSGLDPLKLKVLALTNVTALAEVAKTPEEAVAALKKP